MYLAATDPAPVQFHHQHTPIDSHPSPLLVIGTFSDSICNGKIMSTDSEQIQLCQLDRLVNLTDGQVPAARSRIAVVRCELN